MTEPVLVRELEAIRDAMAQGFSGVHSRLDVINGRVRSAEATQQVLTDRSARNERNIERVEESLADLKVKGCALGEALHSGSAVMVPPWWTPKKIAAAGVGGSAVALGLIEVVKLAIQHFAK